MDKQRLQKLAGINELEINKPNEVSFEKLWKELEKIDPEFEMDGSGELEGYSIFRFQNLMFFDEGKKIMDCEVQYGDYEDEDIPQNEIETFKKMFNKCKYSKYFSLNIKYFSDYAFITITLK